MNESGDITVHEVRGLNIRGGYNFKKYTHTQVVRALYASRDEWEITVQAVVAGPVQRDC